MANKTQYLKIKNVPNLPIIARHTGITATRFIKPLIAQILADFPDHLKETRLIQTSREVRITNISPTHRKQLINLAHNLGVNVSDLVKVRIAQATSGFPTTLPPED